MDDRLLQTRDSPRQDEESDNLFQPWQACGIPNIQSSKMPIKAHGIFTTIVILILISCARLEELHSQGFEVAIKVRQACYDDDTLLSFQYWSDDSVPYCSSLLSLQDRTTYADTVTSTTYVLILPLSYWLLSSFCSTISSLYTTEYDDPTDTVTVAGFTVTSTAIMTHFPTTNGLQVVRRQIHCRDDLNNAYTNVPRLADNPVSSILSDSAGNASIASNVYSACSCLHIKPKTVEVTPTVEKVCQRSCKVKRHLNS